MSWTFTWYPGSSVPSCLPVRQVYAWAWDDAGRVLVIEDGGRVNLPGGTPEPFDADLEATLHREVREEANAVVADPVVIGYQEVRGGDGPPFAQVRVAARLVALGPPAPDPDNGRVYERLLLPVDEVVERLGWGAPGAAQAAAAAIVARELYGLPVCAGATAQGASWASKPVTQVV